MTVYWARAVRLEVIAGRKTLFGMMGVFAEFERSMIQERVKGAHQAG